MMMTIRKLIKIRAGITVFYDLLPDDNIMTEKVTVLCNNIDYYLGQFSIEYKYMLPKNKTDKFKEYESKTMDACKKYCRKENGNPILYNSQYTFETQEEYGKYLEEKRQLDIEYESEIDIYKEYDCVINHMMENHEILQHEYNMIFSDKPIDNYNFIFPIKENYENILVEKQ